MKPSTKLVALLFVVCHFGCQSMLNTSLMEQRVVEQFVEAVREENEPALRRITSTHFEDKALRSKDVLHDLRVLNLPTDELSVVEVKDINENRREVIVKEESGGKYQFHLVNDPKKNLWVVDDVVVRQRTKGTQVTKSTTEVMDLLMTLREFLDVWETGSRDQILAMTSPDLTESLQQLPDTWMQALTKRIASAYEDGMARKPEANLNVNAAVVKLPAKNGHLMIRLVRSSNEWLVDDVEAHNHRETNHPGSIRRQADAMNMVNGFLTAYASENTGALQQMTTKTFYGSSLEMADLSLVSLPKPEDVPAEFDIRAYENLLTFMLPAGKEIVRLDLEEQVSEIPDIVRDEIAGLADNGPRFLVRDVKLYEKGTERQRSLASVFTAPTRAALFLKALADRDHQILSQVSTVELAKGTWKRATPDILVQLPIPQFYDAGLKLTDSHSIGNRTELEFENGSGMVMSCSLMDQNGLLKIDDVQYPNERGQVTSLKSRLELAVPILEVSNAWVNNDVVQLQKACSSDFNRLVWSHLSGVPKRFANTSIQLRAPIVETRVTQERATVRLADGSGLPVTAKLLMEHGYWVVDELQVTEGAGALVEIRETLQNQIAAKLVSGSYSTLQHTDGHKVVMPIQSQQPLDLTEPSGISEENAAQFAKWAHSAETTSASAVGAIQQAAAAVPTDEFGGSMEHAIHRQKTSESAALRVSPAVMTRQLTEDGVPMPSASSPKSPMIPEESTGPRGNFMLVAPHSAAPKSQSKSVPGVQVFGPQAAEIAEALGSAVPTAEPKSSPAPRSGGYMYFGPAAEGMNNSGVSDESVTVIRQPADAPISIE